VTITNQTVEDWIRDQEGFGEEYTLESIEADLATFTQSLFNQRLSRLSGYSNWYSDRRINFRTFPRWVGNPSTGEWEISSGPNTDPADAICNYGGGAKAEIRLSFKSFRNVAIQGSVQQQIAPAGFNGQLTADTPGVSLDQTARRGPQLRALYNEQDADIAEYSEIESEADQFLEEYLESVGITNEVMETLDVDRADIGEATARNARAIFTFIAGGFKDEMELNIVSEGRAHEAWVHYASQSQQGGIIPYAPSEFTLTATANLFRRARIRNLVYAAFRDIYNKSPEAAATPSGRGIPTGRTDEEIIRLAAQDEDGLLEAIEEAAQRQPGIEPDQRSEAERAQQKRFAEQCFLLDYLVDYATINQARNPAYLNERTGEPDFIMVHGPTDTIVNSLVYNPQLEKLNEARTSELSGLVPMLKIFKSSFERRDDGLRGREIIQEVPFHDHVRQSEIDSMLKDNSFDRGRGVGIKSFDWSLEGRDPFMDRRDIYAKLVIYFQSMDQMLQTIQSLPAKYADDNSVLRDGKSFRFIDLVNIGVADAGFDFVWDPNYYKIKAVVGWRDPGGTADSSTFQTPGMKEAIDSSAFVLTLGAYDHEIEITDEGNVTLSIKYMAYQEASYMGPDSDILSTPERRLRRLETLREIVRRRKNGCSSESIADIQQDFTERVRDENYASWNRILDNMYEKDKIFYTTVDTEQLDVYINNGPAAFAQPLLESLGLRRDPSTFSVAANTSLDTPISVYPDSIPSSVDGEDFDDEESRLESLKDLRYTDDEDYQLQFFYFGDLLQAALSEVNTTQEPTLGEDEDILAYGSTGKLDQDMRIILGPISYVLLSKPDEGSEDSDEPPSYQHSLIYDINLADIPISINYYIDWFLGKVVSQERTIYPIISFIREVASDLLANMLRSQCHGLNNVARQNMQLRTEFFTGVANGAGEEALYAKRNVPQQRLLPSSGSPPNQPGAGAAMGPYVDEVPDQGFISDATRVDLDRLGVADMPILRPPARNSDAKFFNYMLLYSTNAGAVLPLGGNRMADRRRGIPYFDIGTSRGIFKSVKFSKNDMPYLKESRLENEFLSEVTGLAILSNVYNVQLNCFGTTAFYPGMKIYVNPAGISPALRSPSEPRSPASILGIGGYHVITNVSSFIESGNFETVVKAIWESGGRSIANPGEEVQSDSEENCGELTSDPVSLINRVSATAGGSIAVPVGPEGESI